MTEVDGWLNPGEAQLLFTVASSLTLPGCIVEIGSYHGKSTIILGAAAKQHQRMVYAVDPHPAWTEPDGVTQHGAEDRVKFLANLVQSGLTDVIVPVGLPSAIAGAGWQESIGLLWIDGNHSYEAVSEDIAVWVKHVAPNGYIAFHDTAHATVSRAVNELLTDTRYQVVQRVDSTTLIQAQTQPQPARPDVSVLIPCYNASETIEKAVLSAIEQTGVSVEVIVCDDGSTALNVSNTYEQIMAYEGNIKLLNHGENRGLSAALNTAADNASGRYFIELDADDYLEPGCLAKMVRALDDNPQVGFVYGQTQYHGNADFLFTPQPYRSEIFRHGLASLYPFMYRREAWDAGCRYRPTCIIDGRMVTIQDWDMALQLTENMRYDALAMPDTLVLHYTYKTGSLTDFTNAHNAEVLAAFKARWPQVVASKI